MRSAATWLCALALLAAPAAKAARKRPAHKPAPAAHGRPEDNPRLKGDARAFARARVRFQAPEDLSELPADADSVQVSLEVSGYALGAAPGAPPDGPQPHAHLVVDEGGSTLTVDDVKEPVLLRGLRPGPHALRVVLCRPWHEVVKAPGAFALVRFRVGPRGPARAAAAAELAAWPDPRKPLLTYVLPLPEPTVEGPRLVSPPVAAASAGDAPLGADSVNPPPPPPAHAEAKGGRAAAKPVPGAHKRTRPVLDFFVSNARLVRHGARVRLVVDKKEYPTVRAWKPVRLDPLKPGQHHVSIDLLDRRGTKVRNALNRNDRTFVLR